MTYYSHLCEIEDAKATRSNYSDVITSLYLLYLYTGGGKGNILGRGEDRANGGGGEEGKDDFRQQLHCKWEVDKKTQKRY